MTTDDHLSTGLQGEDAACRYLAGKGYRIVDRNWRSGRYELDTIARDGDTMVFCEVKTARSHRFGAPVGWVTPRKVRHIARAAMGYIAENRVTGCGFRFDVIGLDITGGTLSITHIPNAFDLPERL